MSSFGRVYGFMGLWVCGFMGLGAHTVLSGVAAERLAGEPTTNFRSWPSDTLSINPTNLPTHRPRQLLLVLQLVQLPINAALFEQFLVGSHFADFSLVEHHDPVAILDG